MTTKAKSYKDLDIYKISYDLAIRVHKMSMELLKYEMYEEGSQVRRSSKSITSNIVEGYGRKRYKAEFIKYLIYAHASCDETITHLNFIKDTNSFNNTDMAALFEEYDKLGAKINRFIHYVENNWRGNGAFKA